MPGRLALASWFSCNPKGHNQVLPSLDLVMEEERAKGRGTTFKSGLRKMTEQYQKAMKKQAVKPVSATAAPVSGKRKRAQEETGPEPEAAVQNVPPQAIPQNTTGNNDTGADPNEFERYLLVFSPLSSGLRLRSAFLVVCCFNVFLGYLGKRPGSRASTCAQCGFGVFLRFLGFALRVGWWFGSSGFSCPQRVSIPLGGPRLFLGLCRKHLG